MGGCATKPKVLKGEEGEAPEEAPAPEPVKEAAGGAVKEAKEVVVVDQEGEKKNIVEGDDDGDRQVGKVKEIVEDDPENKPRSLSNLFKSEESAIVAAESDNSYGNASSEAVVKEEEQEVKETDKDKEEPKEALKKDHTLSSDFVDAPEKPIVEKGITDQESTAPVTETTKEIKDVSEKKKTTVQDTK